MSRGRRQREDANHGPEAVEQLDEMVTEKARAAGDTDATAAPEPAIRVHGPALLRPRVGCPTKTCTHPRASSAMDGARTPAAAAPCRNRSTRSTAAAALAAP